MIEHVPRPVDLLLEFRAMLNNHGRIILTTPNPYFDWAHGFGAAMGFFSHEAHEEHQSLLTKKALYEASSRYRPQIGSLSTLLIWSKSAGCI